MFIEGIIFMLLAITGLRVKFAKLIPEPVKIGESCGCDLKRPHAAPMRTYHPFPSSRPPALLLS